MALFGSDQSINIVVKARDEASKIFDTVAKNASGMSDRLDAATEGSKKLALGLGVAVTAAAGLGYAMLKSASDMEQTRVAFETMLGSAEKADAFIKDLVNFARTTPFELKGLEQSAKQLLAYGFAQEEVLPNLKALGDIASGVGMDKLPNLILAFGQVKAATKLTGMELRQFTEAGVPLLQALTDELNKTGGAMVKVGGSSKKTKVDIGELNDKLKIAKQRLLEASSSAKTKESTLMSLRNTVENYEKKIQDATKSNEGLAGSMVKTKVTVSDVQKMISEGSISFEQVQKALMGLTGEGGRFNDLMSKQSQTLGGMISNLSDAWDIFLRNEGAKLIDWAKVFVAIAIDIVQNHLPKWIDAIDSMGKQFKELEPAIFIVSGALIAALIPAAWAAATAFWAMVAPLLPFIALGMMLGLIIYNLNEIVKLFQEDSEAVILGLKEYWGEFVGFLGKIVMALAQPFVQMWVDTKKQFVDGINFLIGLAEGWANAWVLAANTIIGALNKVSFSIPSWVPGIGGKSFGINIPTANSVKLPRLEFGGIVPGPEGTAQPIIAHGQERIIPASKAGSMGGNTFNVNIYNPVIQDRNDANILRIQVERALRDVVRGHKLQVI